MPVLLVGWHFLSILWLWNPLGFIIFVSNWQKEKGIVEKTHVPLKIPGPEVTHITSDHISLVRLLLSDLALSTLKENWKCDHWQSFPSNNSILKGHEVCICDSGLFWVSFLEYQTMEPIPASLAMIFKTLFPYIQVLFT